MGATSIMARRGRFALALACAAAVAHADMADAAKAKPKPRIAKKLQAPAKSADAEWLSKPPPPNQLQARSAWANAEADRLRSIIAMSPKDERARVLLASLGVVAATDLERSLAIGNAASATGLRDLIEHKLQDTRWRLDWIARHGAGGGHFALGVMALHGIAETRDRAAACRFFESAWNKGFREAAYRYSDCVAHADQAKEQSLLQAAADSGHAMASEQLGRKCLESAPRNAECAFARITAAATAGRPSAKSLLGWMYAQGVGVKADPARAQALYVEAAAAGDLSAKNNLGELYETGRGTPVDAARAAQFYREAADAGFPPAQFNLGRLYATGAGVQRDPEKARASLQSALKAGIQPAQKILDWLDTQPVASP